VSPNKQSQRKPPPKLGESTTQPWVKMVVGLLVAALVIGGAVALFANNDDSGDSNVSTASSTVPAGSTGSTPAAASVKGKPCVAVADALPAGAPAVPVKLGPPPTALVSEDLTPGTGAEAAASSTVTVDYIGVSCSTGKIFDTSYGKTPATFPLNQVIPGWQQGIPGMKVGGSRLLGVPSELAYGAQGYPPDIAPDETLWFVVELKNVS
jgi:peptidylprolyl isomerase